MASTYNMAEYDSDDEHVAAYTHPLKENLDSAATFIIGLLEKRGLDYALMGGYALHVSGSERIPGNVDIAVDTSMKELWQVVTPEPRLVIPQSKLVADIMKIYVHTGEAYGGTCHEDRLVEVGLIIPGSSGCPRDIRSHQQLVMIPPMRTETGFATTDGAPATFKVLDVLYLLKNKLTAVSLRPASKGLHDAGFIVERWPEEVEKVQWMLEEEFQGRVSPFDFMLTPPGSP